MSLSDKPAFKIWQWQKSSETKDRILMIGSLKASLRDKALLCVKYQVREISWLTRLQKVNCAVQGCFECSGSHGNYRLIGIGSKTNFHDENFKAIGQSCRWQSDKADLELKPINFWDLQKPSLFIFGPQFNSFVRKHGELRSCEEKKTFFTGEIFFHFESINNQE